MMRIVAALAALLALAPFPARAAPYFTDNFDGYTSNLALPNGPWHGSSALSTAPGNAATSTLHDTSAPNSVVCGAGGNPSNMYQSIGTSVNGMTITFSIWPVTYGSGGFGDPVGSICLIGGHIVASGASLFPAVAVNLNTTWGSTLPPPSGKVYVTALDCSNNAIGTSQISDSTFHTIVVSWSCAGTINDFVSLKIDGVTQSLAPTVQFARLYDQAVIAGGGIGSVPPAYGYYDDFIAAPLTAPSTDDGNVGAIQ